jgi:hypothetical protein
MRMCIGWIGLIIVDMRSIVAFNRPSYNWIYTACVGSTSRCVTIVGVKRPVRMCSSVVSHQTPFLLLSVVLLVS